MRKLSVTSRGPTAAFQPFPGAAAIARPTPRYISGGNALNVSRAAAGRGTNYERGYPMRKLGAFLNRSIERGYSPRGKRAVSIQVVMRHTSRPALYEIQRITKTLAPK